MVQAPFSSSSAAGEFLQALVQSASAPIAVLDRRSRYVTLSAAHAQANGRPLEDHLGRTVEEMAPSLAYPLGRLLTRVFDSGQALQGQRVVRDVPGEPGQVQAWTVDLLPVPGEAAKAAFVCVLFTPAEQRRAALERSSIPDRLWELALTLHRAPSVPAVVQTILEEAVPTTGALAAGVSLLNEDRSALKVLGATGYDAATLHAWPSVPLTLGIPATQAVNEARALFLTWGDVQVHYPELTNAPTYADMAHVALPLMQDDVVLGCLSLSFGDRGAFTEAEQRVMTALAAACAQTITALRGREAELAARMDQERMAAFLDSVLTTMPTGVAFVDLRLRFLHVNAAFAAYTGRDAAALPEARWSDALPEWTEVLTTLAIVRQTRTPSHQRVMVSQPDGTRAPVEVEVTPVLSAQGHLLALKCEVTRTP